MPHRKLVQIGQPSKLPTVAEFFLAMAQQQGRDIERLKAEAASRTGFTPMSPAAKHHKAAVKKKR